MRLTGTLTDWKDDKGFGFVSPIGVGEKVFVHVSAFGSMSRRPRVGDRLTYELDQSSAKGPRAVRVRVEGLEHATPAPHWRIATLAAFAFLVALIVGVATDDLPSWLLFAVPAASAVSFVAYALDKQAARDGRWRISEEALHTIDLLGGWPGGAFAQQWLRHKSIKPSFQAAYWFTVVVNLVLVALVTSRELRRMVGLSF